MSEGVGRYRRVYPRIWQHPGFHQLTRSTRELALYLLTGPQTNRVGLFHLSVANASEDLNVSAETIRKGLVDIASAFGWMFDAQARVFYIPSWWHWNPPANANVLKGNLRDLSEIPPCGLVEIFARNLEMLPETLHQTFTEGCAIRLAQRPSTQEQEQDPLLKQENGQRASRGNDEHSVSDRLERIARLTLRMANPSDAIEQLLDAFGFIARKEGVQNYTTAAATQALNVALSERREARSRQQLFKR